MNDGQMGSTATMTAAVLPRGKSLDVILQEIGQDDQDDKMRRFITECESALIRGVMAVCKNNQVKAADQLGWSRMTLRTRLRQMGFLPSRSS